MLSQFISIISLFRFLSLYIFTGFFITLCFVTTKKVRGLIRERFSKRRNEVVKVQASSSRDHRTGFTNVERVSGSSPVSSRRGMQNFAYSVSCVWIHPFSFVSERNSLALVEESNTILVLGKMKVLRSFGFDDYRDQRPCNKWTLCGAKEQRNSLSRPFLATGIWWANNRMSLWWKWNWNSDLRIKTME